MAKSNRVALWCALAALLSVFVAYQTNAQVLDPQIYVCTGCTAAPMGDPDVIDPSSINVGFDGNHSAVSPLLILVAVPNAGADPTISLPSMVNPIAAGTYYGGATTGNLTGSLDGTLSATSVPPPPGMDATVYSQALGITDNGGSENWTNLAGYDTSHGITVLLALGIILHSRKRRNLIAA